MSVQNATAKIIAENEIEHYVRVYKAHEELRLNTNDRNNYWKKYNENK